MGKSCVILKKCSVCLQEKHNLAFDSHKEGRTGIKPYCKTCKPIYKGIKAGLVPEQDYVGFDFDVNQLTGDHYGHIILLKEQAFEKIPVEKAKRMVEQGAACVTSSSTVQYLLGNFRDGKAIKEYVFTRDKGKCHYCINKAVTVDHVIPKFNGGLDTPLNLVGCCKECNELKGNMSKDEFITRLKNGDYDYFTRSWKEHVKIKTLTKKCKTCGVEKETTLFPSQEVNCHICTNLHNAVTVGLITKDELKQISQTYHRLKEQVIQVIEKDGQYGRRIVLQKANDWVEKGIAYPESDKSIRLLFDEEGIQRLHPGFSLYQTAPGSQKEHNQAVQQNDALAKLSKTVIVHTPERHRLCTIPKTVAVTLVERKLAYIINADVLRLNQSVEETLQRYDMFRNHVPVALPAAN